MAVRESSPGRGKTTYNTPSVFTRLDTLETEVGGIVVPDVTGKADKTYVDSQDGVLSAQLAESTQIKGTTQSIIFNTDGTVQKVQHKDASNNIVREDDFTYTTNLITEVRTVGSSSITFKYHLDTLQTEVI